MIDPATFEFNSEPNYLNHPPFYYRLIAILSPKIAGQPSSLVPIRMLNVTKVACGLMALLILGRRMQLAQPEFYAFAAMIAATPVLAPLAGSANNDNLGFVGGAFGMLGLYAYAGSFARSWLIVACCGMIAASAAKLTGLMLVGTTVTLTVALMAMRHRLSRMDLLMVAISLVVAGPGAGHKPGPNRPPRRPGPAFASARSAPQRPAVSSCCCRFTRTGADPHNFDHNKCARSLIWADITPSRTSYIRVIRPCGEGEEPRSAARPGRSFIRSQHLLNTEG